MNEKHIHRVLGLLGDQRLSHLPSAQKYYGFLQDRDGNYAQWKWFYKEIGKHNCILSLMAFAPAAFHVSRTPIVTPYLNQLSYEQSLLEAEELVRDKFELLSEWVARPSKMTRRKIVETVQASRFSYLSSWDTGAKLPVHGAAFITKLLNIIAAEQNFERHVNIAFSNLDYLGFPNWYTEHVFKERLIAIYRTKLGDSESILPG